MMSDWGFIYLAYGVTGLGLGAYAWSLISRIRTVSRDLGDEEATRW